MLPAINKYNSMHIKGLCPHKQLNIISIVSVEAINFLTPLTDITLKVVGLKAVFECVVSKDGLTPTWLFKGDKTLKRGEKYDIQSKNGTHSLTIESAHAEDIGPYTIKFEEGAESTGKLNINGE